jgi:hypothetical protein
MRSFPSNGETPMSEVSKGAEGASWRISSAVAARVRSKSSRSTPSFGAPRSGSASGGVSSRRNRVGRVSSAVSEAW